MQLNRDYLVSKYEYDPRNETFIYKVNPFKRVSWNDRYVGTEVKPLKIGNTKYLCVNNAIYPMNQLIKLWEEGENERLNAIDVEELRKKEAKRLAMISSMSISDLKLLQEQMLKNEPYRISNKKARKTSSIVNKSKVATIACDVFEIGSTKVNAFGIPIHIYYDGMNNDYYVKIIYKNRKIVSYGLDSINAALKVRDQSYKELIKSDEHNH